MVPKQDEAAKLKRPRDADYVYLRE